MVISPLAILRYSLLVILLSLFAACSSTKIVNEWREADYVSPHFKKVVVLGVSDQAALRRSFEDEFVAELRSAGIQAVPSYQFLPEEGQVPEPRLLNSVKQSGADAAIMTRFVRVEHKTRVTPDYYDRYPGFYHWYASRWTGFYDPQVYNYDVYTSETSLYDLKQDRLVWAGTVQTTAAGDVSKEIKSYVRTIMDGLKERDLLRTVLG